MIVSIFVTLLLLIGNLMSFTESGLRKGRMENTEEEKAKTQQIPSE
jgi:hypothetical protein